VLEVADERGAVLLANHGVVAFGKTIDEAVGAALVVEEAARVALVCQSLGGGAQLPPEEVTERRRVHLTRNGQHPSEAL